MRNVANKQGMGYGMGQDWDKNKKENNNSKTFMKQLIKNVNYLQMRYSIMAGSAA